MVCTQSGFLRNISRSAKWFIDHVGLRTDVPLIAQHGYHAKSPSSLILHEDPEIPLCFCLYHPFRMLRTPHNATLSAVSAAFGRSTMSFAHRYPWSIRSQTSPAAALGI
jgi:hypothetical protein